MVGSWRFARPCGTSHARREELAEQARYLMLGRPSSAEEILGVVDLLEDREPRR